MSNHAIHHNNNTKPRPPRSDRGIVSVTLLVWSSVSLLFTLVGVVKLAYDVFILDQESNVPIKVLVLTIGFILGLGVALLGIRAFHNLVLPLIIRFYIWIILTFTTVVYILITIKLYTQLYSLERYVAYAAVMAAGLGAIVGFHLILEDHSLRPLSLPLLIVSMVQLVSIIYRYVFTDDALTSYFMADIVFFSVMLLVAIAMIGHFGVLNFLRTRIDNLFSGFK